MYQEMVVLVGEAKNTQANRMLPIFRTDAGGFWNLGDATESTANSFKGRFTQLLPPNPPDEQTRCTGMALLEALGAKITLVPADGK